METLTRSFIDELDFKPVRENQVSAIQLHYPFRIQIDTGFMHGLAGDWLVKTRSGSVYPCSSKSFDADYEILPDYRETKFMKEETKDLEPNRHVCVLDFDEMEAVMTHHHDSVAVLRFVLNEEGWEGNKFSSMSGSAIIQTASQEIRRLRCRIRDLGKDQEESK